MKPVRDEFDDLQQDKLSRKELRQVEKNGAALLALHKKQCKSLARNNDERYLLRDALTTLLHLARKLRIQEEQLALLVLSDHAAARDLEIWYSIDSRSEA